MSSQAPAGWYPQPDGTQRWWTGTAWSDAAPASGAVVHGELVRPQPGPAPYPSVPTSYPLPPGQPAPLVAGTHGYAPAVRVAPKSAGVAVIASFFLPGLGQFINGQAGKGMLFLACYLLGFPLLLVFRRVPRASRRLGLVDDRRLLQRPGVERAVRHPQLTPVPNAVRIGLRRSPAEGVPLG